MTVATDTSPAVVPNVKSWLETALDAWFREDADRWAFQPFALSIGHESDLARDLALVYRDQPAAEQARWKQAVRDLLAERGTELSFRPALEVLLDLATLMPAPDVLEVLPRLIAEGDSPAAKRMANRVVGAAVSLSTPTKSAVDCLEQIRTSPLFAAHHAGLVLTALCRVDPDRWTEHVVNLEPAMQRLASEHLSDEGALRLYASNILQSITLSRVTAEAFARLWSGLVGASAERWNWLCNELLVGERHLLAWHRPHLQMSDNTIVSVDVNVESPLTDPPESSLLSVALPDELPKAVHELGKGLEERGWLKTETA